MPRPKRCRRICEYPSFWSFGPEKVEAAETVNVTLDEFEAIRLIDHEKLTQEECASAMGVSRATVTSIYESARFKLADALVKGKRIRFTGGCYRIDTIPASAAISEKGENVTRIAVPFVSGTVGQHFGQTEQFQLYDIVDGRVQSSQLIDTNGVGHGALAGFLRAAEVETLICGGIGMGARSALEEVGIRLLPGVSGEVDRVVSDFLTGSLEVDPSRVLCLHASGADDALDCQAGSGCMRDESEES